MSGGGSSFLPSGNNSIEDLDCNNLFLETILSSPDSKVLSKLSVNDALMLSEGINGVVIAVTDSGEIAGSVSSSVTRIKKCIADGFNFVGVIIELDGAKCRIQIRPQAF